jgi:hypothetical protein
MSSAAVQEAKGEICRAKKLYFFSSLLIICSAKMFCKYGCNNEKGDEADKMNDEKLMKD